MLDEENRKFIVETFSNAMNDLVKNLYIPPIKGILPIQEAEITSRLCQRLEDKLDGKQAGDYTFRITAQSLPDRGPNSIERAIGADIFMSVSLDGPNGFDKGIFIQSKTEQNIKKGELQKACHRMKKVAGEKGSYVWVYTTEGIKSYSSHQIDTMNGNTLEGLQPYKLEGFMGRVLDCHAGSKKWGIPNDNNRRQLIGEKLIETRAKHILDIQLIEG